MVAAAGVAPVMAAVSDRALGRHGGLALGLANDDPSTGAERDIDRAALVVGHGLRSTTLRSTAVCSFEPDFVRSRFNYCECYWKLMNEVRECSGARVAKGDRGARSEVVS